MSAVRKRRIRAKRRDDLGDYQLGSPDEGLSSVKVQEGEGEWWMPSRDGGDTATGSGDDGK